MEQAADTVKTTSLQLAEDVKEKSGAFSDSLAENAAVVKSKSLELAENMKEKTSEVADSIQKGAVAVAENVQGRIAPKTVKREGYLAKQVNGNKWIEYYFDLRDGTVSVLTTQTATTPELTIGLDTIMRAEALDVVVTGKPYCFRVSLKLVDRPDTVVNNWSFFGSNLFTSNKVNNQEIDLILQATNEDEMRGWVRELYSTSSGLSMQEQVKKTGEGASARVYSLVESFTSMVGISASAGDSESTPTSTS